MIRVLEMVIDFSGKDTKAYRKKTLNEVHKLQILLRLCKDLSFLKFRKYEYASSLLAEISGNLKTDSPETKTQNPGLSKSGGGSRDGLQRFVR